jgi:molybdate transport system substrate-binding protein
VPHRRAFAESAVRRACGCAAAALLLAAAAPGFAQEAGILVSAAASLTDVLTALAPAAEKAVGARILLNFGASGILRRQIEEGAPADVFFSASNDDMDKLESQGLILSESRKPLLSNSLVLVGAPDVRPARSVAELRTLLSAASLLAIGNPDSVPAGRYAAEALDSLGLSTVVKGRLVLGGNVREVLQYVLSGSAPLGIVFSTDALSAGSRIRTLFQFDRNAVQTPVVYPVAVVSASKKQQASIRLIEFLQGPVAREAFRKAGFTFP